MKPLLPLVLLFVPLSAAAEAGRVRLVVYHVNDVHGWVLPRKAWFHKADPERRIGGCAALAAYLDKEEPGDLLLDAGDWWQGTPEGGLTQGRAAVDCFSKAGVDASVVGNHEFDDGPASLRSLVSVASYPVLGANVYDEKTGERVSWLKPRVLFEAKGVKVGVFGLLTDGMRGLAFPEHIAGLRFREELDEARDQVAALKAEGAQVVIALTHMGFEDEGSEACKDKCLAAKVPGIDLVVGGHSHTPVQAPHQAGGAAVAQAGSYLTRVGKVVLEFDRGTGKVARTHGRLDELWLDQYGEDPEIKAWADKLEAEVGKKLDVAVGRAAGTLSKGYKEENSAGLWMADCMRERAGTAVAFMNAGGVRADIPEGPITLRHLYQLMPFDNTVVTAELTGQQVRRALEHGVARDGGVILVSGLEFSFDPEAEDGRRVREVKAAGKPLDEKARYRAATNSFIAAGGDGYRVFEEATWSERGRLLRDELRACVEKGPVAPPALGRMRAAK